MAFTSQTMGSQSGAEESAQNHKIEGAHVELDRLTLKVEHILHFNKDSGFFILEGQVPAQAIQPKIIFKGKPFFGKKLVVKGVSPTFGNHQRTGQSIDFFGKWEEHPQYGLQFTSEYSNECLPDSPEALEDYLASGHLPGVGPAMAKQIIQLWGAECFEVLESSPEKLVEIKGITLEKALKIQQTWKDKKTTYEIVSFLGLHGVGESNALKVQEKWGSLAIAKIKENPFLLTQVEGIGFKTADRVALSLGLPGDNPLRLKAALRYELDAQIQKEGNMAMPWESWVLDGVKQLGLPVGKVQEMAQSLINEYEVVLRDLPVTLSDKKNHSGAAVVKVMPCVSPRWAAQIEERISLDLKRILDKTVPLTTQDLVTIEGEVRSPRRKLDESQQEGAWTVLTNAASVLTGGPGTGKTTTLKSVVQIAKQLGWKVVLAAPTARAAKRMEEAIGMESQTMHRCLKYNPRQGFQVNDKNPMDGMLFILDETSMVPSVLLGAWLRAIPSGAKIIFVGDADQLPSVGSGDTLRDLIQSKVIPVARLTTIHRTAAGSGIAENARKVNRGMAPFFGGDPWTDDYAFVETETDEDSSLQIESLVSGFLRQGIRHEDIQILCPQKNGKVGTDMLNQSLRWILNPLAPTKDFYEEIPPCIEGERLMQTVNDYDLEVFNGDLGTVHQMEEDGSFRFRIEDGREVPMVASNLRRMELGYAMTVHKSQGGERPVVIMPISRAHLFTLNRNLLFTGMTRGKSKLVLVGNKQAVLLAARKQDQQYRLTGLVQEMKLKNVQSPPQPVFQRGAKGGGSETEDPFDAAYHGDGVKTKDAKTLGQLDRELELGDAWSAEQDGFSM